MVKISIIVPVYNPPEQSLKKCVESLIQQTYVNLEIILIDNKSTGNCPKILEEYSRKDNRIKLIVFDENQGFAGACNKGLEIASGDYVQFVDSDDWLFPDSVAKIVHKLINTNYPDLLLFGAAVYDDKKQFLDMNSDSYMWVGVSHYLNDKVFTYDDVKQTIFLSMGEAWSKIYKNDFLKSTKNNFDTELGSTCVDVFFNFNNYINASSYAILRERLYVYRTNLKNSICSGLAKKHCDYVLKPILFAKKVEAMLEMHNISFSEAEFPIKAVVQLLYSLFVNVIHVSNKKIFYDECRKLFLNANKNIYTEDNIFATNVSKWFYCVTKYPYWLYRLLSYNLFSSNSNHYILNLIFFKIKIRKPTNKMDNIIGMLDYQNRHILELESKIENLNKKLEIINR